LGREPLRPRRHPRGKFRFDAPRDGAEYAVTYANLAEHGAFAEVYGDTQLISELETTRRLSALVATRPLNLVALDDPTVQKTLKPDGRIAMSKQYEATMLWSRGLHRWFPSADGIRYASRHAGADFPKLLPVPRSLPKCAPDRTPRRPRRSCATAAHACRRRSVSPRRADPSRALAVGLRNADRIGPQCAQRLTKQSNLPSKIG
jgi:hypothetical protein